MRRYHFANIWSGNLVPKCLINLMSELNESLKVIKTSKDNENISMCVSGVLTDLRGKTLFILERFSLLYYFPYYSCVCTSVACSVISASSALYTC